MYLNSSPLNLHNNTRTNLSLNNNSNLNNNSLVESKNISKNQYLNCSNQKSHWNNENINKQEKGNSSLRKKKKIYFNVEKNSEQKPVFITTKINKNLRFGTNNIKYDNKTIINNKNFIKSKTFLYN